MPHFKVFGRERSRWLAQLCSDWIDDDTPIPELLRLVDWISESYCEPALTRMQIFRVLRAGAQMSDIRARPPPMHEPAMASWLARQGAE
jgi:hypothetical protein